MVRCLLSHINIQPWWLGGRACNLYQVGCHSATVDQIPLEDIIPAIEIIQIRLYGPYYPTDVCYKKCNL